MTCEHGAFPWREAPAIVPLRSVSARFVRRPWAWADANRALIERRWRRAVAHNPRLFNGTVLLSARPVIRDGHYETACQPVDFAAFLAWRDLGWPDRSVVNGFSMAALRAADGAFVATIQAAHTATAGAIYFAAGTPDLADVRADGTVDLAGNIVRELREETGLNAGELSFSPEWTAVLDGGRVALMREARSSLPADELARRIHAHIASDPDAELAGVALIRSAADIDPARMQPFMTAWLAWRLPQDA